MQSVEAIKLVEALHDGVNLTASDAKTRLGVRLHIRKASTPQRLHKPNLALLERAIPRHHIVQHLEHRRNSDVQRAVEKAQEAVLRRKMSVAPKRVNHFHRLRHGRWGLPVAQLKTLYAFKAVQEFLLARIKFALLEHSVFEFVHHRFQRKRCLTSHKAPEHGAHSGAIFFDYLVNDGHHLVKSLGLARPFLPMQIHSSQKSRHESRTLVLVYLRKARYALLLPHVVSTRAVRYSFSG
mmetsp:Transcript_15533/g.41773  ORF Transcript_15533/g.41773 Transcript_15533/m.41773 type:complete len:238 (-) Transcript_15533:906-1619(-)